ncbi:MAG: beta-carotene hydroxylase [Gammaproteobacteria bacterium]|jgi:beta-carotene hydroxylase|nr:beta-carotene hydroxylase [Gammaproteobacteria bacterium]
MINATVYLNSMSESELDVLECKIAGKYIHKAPWGAVVWGIGNLIAWLALWPLVLMDIIPLWFGFILATLNVSLSYLPSHEAQHNIIAGKGQPLRWLNELVGHLSTIPLVLPYRVLRHTHYEHHSHTNDPQLDPDFNIHADSGWHFLWKSIMNRQPESGRSEAYPETLKHTGNEHMILDAVIYQTVYLTIMFTLAWSGYAIEAALLWWVPKQIAITYIEYYLGWAPHHPSKEQGRYANTRGFKSRLGNLLSMGMQYHIIHHLYSKIPLALTSAAYRALKPILQRRNCHLGEL